MKLFKMKTRQMVDKSFSQYLVYQAFQAISHDIFNDKTWFPTSRCSCEDVFYEVFCIVDKMMFSHTDTESRLAFVEGVGQYEKTMLTRMSMLQLRTSGRESYLSSCIWQL